MIIPVFRNINLSELIKNYDTGKLHKSGKRNLEIFLKEIDNEIQIYAQFIPIETLF